MGLMIFAFFPRIHDRLFCVNEMQEVSIAIDGVVVGYISIFLLLPLLFFAWGINYMKRISFSLLSPPLHFSLPREVLFGLSFMIMGRNFKLQVEINTLRTSVMR